MSSISIAGDTSGAITLSAPAVAGTNTITLPAATGTVVLTGTTPTLNGITFPATQVPSADANTLDDYEEGTWTPTILTTGTAFSNGQSGSGRYTRIGNKVTVFGNVNLNGVTSGGTGNVRMGGLPFTASSNSGSDAYGVWLPGRVAINFSLGYVISALGGDTKCAIYYLVDSANPGELPASALNGQSTPYWSFTITYLV